MVTCMKPSTSFVCTKLAHVRASICECAERVQKQNVEGPESSSSLGRLVVCRAHITLPFRTVISTSAKALTLAVNLHIIRERELGNCE